MMTPFLRDFKIPLILISEIILILLFADYVPQQIQSISLAISLSIKEILLFTLPVVIFSFLGNSIGSLKQGAFRYIALVFLMIFLSNFFATFIGGSLGLFVLEKVGFIAPVLSEKIGLMPVWSFDLSPLIENDKALLLGLIAGLLVSIFNVNMGKKILHQAHYFSLHFLKKAFIPLLPLFILGFIFKMESDGILTSVFRNYFPIALIIIAVAITCVSIVLLYACDFKITSFKSCLKNFVPAMVTGFTTMSSASTLPFVIDAVEKNTKDESTPGVVPVSINSHLVGDCFSMSIQAIAILIAFGHSLPSLVNFMMFVLFFTLARFAVAAVPGGGVLMTLPAFETYLGFNGEMLSLITALYILFDPLITPVNVLGHGTFAQVFEKLYRKIR